MAFVVDNSVAMSWCFADERTASTMALLDRVMTERVMAPPIWPLEATNVLFVAERRRRITRTQRIEFLGFLRDLPIKIEVGRDIWGELSTWGPEPQLCDRYGLTAYDASYLALALKHRIPLATRDKALIAAAKDQNLPLLETL
ncbi:MAG TPA: type II toxin-antitoxin system VapC family toxin [Acidisoma sp.]|jgi:predicted nucleic acid-binding protein|uniref:type II toxin-antitoxin system VapC family toxin n=1 Tax=Acidisoma sp. TaxID=1872115 RepID=UPI002C6B39BA|nr:type II toxin-antitoxin system VapC family toxin [Acidisoma sp.]HTI01984.1 type II toxin-antitoxin system VapC family toxin [Acidisoma sp.]